MRNAFANAFYEAARSDQRVFLVVADITAAAGVASFRKEFPNRFVDVGLAEQTMVGFSAGLALRGCIPFTYSIAPFTLYRPFEQIRVDCCYQNLPVRLVGVGGGVCYSTLGGTHHSPEDVAVLGALPNMSVLAPCDPAETKEATQATFKIPGPVYLRLGKAGEPDLTSQAPESFVTGKIRLIRKGGEWCFLTYGPIAKMAFEVAARLEKGKGISPAIYSVHTLKPLDRSGISEILKKYRRVVVVEEHSWIGGLGAQVKSLAWDARAPCQISAFSLRDEFIHTYGNHEDLLKAHGLSPDLIMEKLLL